MFTLSAIRSSTADSLRLWALDSPVRGALFTTRSSHLTNRPSAAIRSPSDTMRMSPGTRSSAKISTFFPSRLTHTRGGRNFFRASIAFSARYSCIKLKRAFRKDTPSSAQPNTSILLPGSILSATKQIMAETFRRMVKKLVNCFMKVRAHFHLSITSTVFLPTSSSRSSISCRVKPSGRVSR